VPADALKPLLEGGETDVTGRQPLGHDRRVESPPVVLDHEDEAVSLLGEADPDVSRAGVSGGVGEELAGDRRDEALVCMPISVVQVEVHVEAAALGRTPRDRWERRLEAGLLEDVRVELEDRVS
jgi:hypothetical protein